MSAAEVNFILAESAQRGWATGNAETLYNAAIKASFDAWGVAAGYPAYIAGEKVKYNGSLKQLIEQKWISSWTAAAEAWFDYRRTGYPELTTGSQALRQAVPVRFFYMLDERNLNKANSDVAVGRLESTPFTGPEGANSPWSKPWVIQGTGKPW